LLAASFVHGVECLSSGIRKQFTKNVGMDNATFYAKGHLLKFPVPQLRPFLPNVAYDIRLDSLWENVPFD